MDKRKQATRDRLVKKITQNNVYKNTSKISSLNNGLFAKRDIKAGEKYAEFVGELYGPNQQIIIEVQLDFLMDIYYHVA